ncbi:hypothetical protein MRB53_042075 [Persea americana]|nr:hypothetical protein MRB53_042075 [Persea americana]
MFSAESDRESPASSRRDIGSFTQNVPFAEYDHKTSRTWGVSESKSHTRWHSVDVVPVRTTPARSLLGAVRNARRSFNLSRSSEDEPTAYYCAPDVVGNVAQMFLDHVRDKPGLIAAKLPEDYDKAIELLAAHVNPSRTREENRKKAMTMKDLLIKVQLCGCLHVAYRGKDRIHGTYAVCILFESTFVLADADEGQQKYSVLAGIALGNATIEEADNGKGLQCCTAPHSWKIIFEHAALVFELILTACSATEAEVWRSHLSAGIDMKNRAENTGIFELHSPLTAEMRSIGKAFGKPSSFVRRMPVHRAATVGPNTDLNHVIIKNTQAVKEVQDCSSQTSLRIPRSQSDLLPYPGMARRSDPIRASANHVIRKFSMASITSNFSSKRTASSTSINMLRRRDDGPKLIRRKSGEKRELDTSLSQSSARRTRAPPNPPINFHTTPRRISPRGFPDRRPCYESETFNVPLFHHSHRTTLQPSPRIRLAAHPPSTAYTAAPKNANVQNQQEKTLPLYSSFPTGSHPLPTPRTTNPSPPSHCKARNKRIRQATAHPPHPQRARKRKPYSPASPNQPPLYSIVRDRPHSPAAASFHGEPLARKPRGKSMLSRLFA